MRCLTVFGLLLTLSFCLSESESYRILGLFPLPSKSHMVMFEALMKGLAEKGHQVDVLSHFLQEKPIPRYKDISVRGTVPIYVNNYSIPFIQERLRSYSRVLEFIFVDAGTGICRNVLHSPTVRELKNTKKKYDLIIAEIFGTDCFLGFAHLFKIPVIGITSSVAVPWGNDRIVNPDNPSYIPNYLMHSSSRMNLIDRLTNTLSLIGAKLGYEIVSHRPSDTLAREFFGSDLPDINDLARNTSLVLVNSHFSVSSARPTVTNFIEVGGLHIKPPNPLPKHLDEVLDIGSQYKGVIYLSMGSMALTETFSLDKLQAFLNAFRDLPFKIVWKANGERMPKDLNIPLNIHFEQWLPQKDILCHPNVKLFITHGGMLGSQEAVYCGVPRLGIPLFADQELNLIGAESLDLAIMIKYEDLTENKIRDALKLLLFDNRYKESTERISRIFKDRPLSPVDTAIYWVEYVIQHQGAFHLRSVGADLPWYQYYLVDVGIIIFVILLLSTIISYYLSYILKKILCVFKRKRLTKEKSN
ncbi:hypothetical protein ILUMI_24094 [Ignelater luminosus]|uniref:UDP-glucuronosyltransferase n=1 Tax=Ignelater luminosus TaxID=2038154 RepID=A0A8K0G103_IGNLU|nr:hypothetical protein ILUMI_24094 [Ignelater luminosus]